MIIFDEFISYESFNFLFLGFSISIKINLNTFLFTCKKKQHYALLNLKNLLKLTNFY
jgi:hypothetical protein